VDLDPDFVGRAVVLAEPRIEALGILELADFGGIDDDRGQGFAPRDSLSRNMRVGARCL
jgi:hypothetical protein